MTDIHESSANPKSLNEFTDVRPEDSITALYIGQHETSRATPVNQDLLSHAKWLGYDFLTLPITTAAFYSRVVAQLESYYQRTTQTEDKASTPLPQISPLTPADTTLDPRNNNHSLVGLVSPWIDLGSQDPAIAQLSRQILRIEVAYAAFCGVNNVIIYGPRCSSQTLQFARDVREALGLGPYLELHILLPMSGELETDYGDLIQLSELTEASDVAEDIDVDVDDVYEDAFGSWNMWNTIRSVCDYSQKLTLALEIPRQLPLPSLQSTWYSEPIRLLVFPRTAFLRNPKGFPVLSRQHQQLLTRLIRLKTPPWMLLSDVDSLSATNNQSPEPTPAEAAFMPNEKQRDPFPHLRYLRHLQQSQPPPPPMERFGQGYQDHLLSPLQPLTDNLESITYEVFEKDPVKYEWYERAIAAALKDLAAVLTQPRKLVVAVVGAGRGPLVTRALQASRSTGIVIECWAVEKNPNAFVLLQSTNTSDPLWNGQVNVVKSDMRYWQGPNTLGSEDKGKKVDILISELLGSFADNELSPECLDGVESVLHPDHGISIPQSYSAHLTPISTPRIHADLHSRQWKEKWEIPYVVMLHQYHYLCTSNTGENAVPVPDVRTAWSFAHPLPDGILEHAKNRASGSMDAGGCTGGNGSNEHNTRTCSITLDSSEGGICHGLAGYFETVLYANGTEKIELSTNPLTMEEKSRDMISWFPIFFPLETPLYIPPKSSIEVSMWRQTDDRSVWYEWIVAVSTLINGRLQKTGMSRLHSSRKNACLV